MPPRRRVKPRSPATAALGESIRRFRLEQGLTQEDLADRADMDHFSTIGNIERGTANPTFLTLLRVADALEISLGKLTGRSDRIQRQMRKTRKSAKRK